MSSKNIIDFIAKDTEKIELWNRRRYLLLVSSLLIPLIYPLIFGFRDNLSFSFMTWFVLSIFIVTLVFVSLVLKSGVSYKMQLFSAAASLFLLLLASLAEEWSKSGGAGPHSDTFAGWLSIHGSCFVGGGSVGIGVSFVLLFLVFLYSPVSSRATRVVTSFISALAGLMALDLHCPGAGFEHLLLSHWGQATIIFFTVFLVQELLVYFKVRNLMKERLNSLKGISSLTSGK